MSDHRNACAGPRRQAAGDCANRADLLTALAQQARLLEFGLEGDGEDARGMATAMETALTGAMEADSAEEIQCARDAIDTVLLRVARCGMRLNARLDDMEIGGVLGMARMPVLTAVLSA